MRAVADVPQTPQFEPKSTEHIEEMLQNISPMYTHVDVAGTTPTTSNSSSSVWEYGRQLKGIGKKAGG